MTPRVSVILPVFNGAPSLARAIASVRTQTLADWELLVIDDGSQDGSAAIAASEARDDPRLVLVSLPHGGLVAALSAGLARARAGLIARLDADDECHPERLERQVALLAARPELGLASCLVEFGGDRERNAGYALHVDWLNSVVTDADLALNRFVESPLAHPSVLFRRELVDRFGGYRNGDFPEDYELWLRWLDAGVRMAKVPQVLLRWHDGDARLSRTDQRYDPEKFFRLKAGWIARELARHRGPVPTAAGTASELAADCPRPSVASAAPRAGSAGPVGGGRPVWIWGAGRPTRKRAGWLGEHGVRISGYIDIDAKKTGRTVGGVPVVAPDGLPAPGEAFVLGYVSSRGARELIRAALRSRGHVEGRDFLMCA